MAVCVCVTLCVARATLNLYQLVSKHQKANRDEVELEETNEQLNRVSPYPSPHPPPTKHTQHKIGRAHV